MLRSVRIVFEMIGLEPESIKFIKEEFNSSNLVQALTEQPKKCPTIVTFNLNGDKSPHIMVATNALKGKEFILGSGYRQMPTFIQRQYAHTLKDKWFINCKNSYRDDTSEPGKTRLKTLTCIELWWW